MKTSRESRRHGKVVVLIAVLMPVLAGMGAFAIDTGHIVLSRARLQAVAEAAALAAVEELPNGQTAVTKAQNLALLNFDNAYQNIVATNDIEFGVWDDGSFTVTNVSTANAVRVTAQLSAANGNRLALFFGPVLGMSSSDVVASAVAMRPSGGIGTRFLIDEDMFDKDTPAIEDLANALSRDAEELVTARGFNAGRDYGDSDWTWCDNFVDIPAGSTLILPTGQGTSYDNNDAGLFEIGLTGFPFSSEQSFEDFLFYSETGNDSSKWGTDLSYILDDLDPLDGVEPITDDSLYDSFCDADFIHVSPVFPSDISTLNKSGGNSRVNAKGLRRGLLAYKIIAVDNNPSGSDLPELEIEIVDPSTITESDLGLFGSGSGGSSGASSAQIVQ